MFVFSSMFVINYFRINSAKVLKTLCARRRCVGQHATGAYIVKFGAPISSNVPTPYRYDIYSAKIRIGCLIPGRCRVWSRTLSLRAWLTINFLVYNIHFLMNRCHQLPPSYIPSSAPKENIISLCQNRWGGGSV